MHDRAKDLTPPHVLSINDYPRFGLLGYSPSRSTTLLDIGCEPSKRAFHLAPAFPRCNPIRERDRKTQADG